MTEDEILKQKAEQILQAYKDSNEYKRFVEVTSAMDKDKYISGLVKEMDELQAICRTKETNLLEKKEVLARIEQCKAKLYSTALWTNYLSCKADLERLKSEIIERLDGKIG